MEPVCLFYSYAHEDESLRNELAGHLKIMERRGVLRSWFDRRILPGQTWDKEIDDHLQKADIVLLLVSADFVNSDYIWGHELTTAMDRHARGETNVVPVLIRACLIEDAPFANLQGLPTDLRPVTSWPNRDEAWTDVAKGIRRSAGEINDRRMAATSSTPVPSTGEQGEIQETVNLTELAPVEVAVVNSGDTVEVEDALLGRVLQEATASVIEAAANRGKVTINQAATERDELELIDSPKQKRVLWVDDRPENNRLEAATLSKLQIEMVTATCTEEALKRIAQDSEGFDLVLSDWQRPEKKQGAPSAGIQLLRDLKAQKLDIPIVFYHASFNEKQRQSRRKLALKEGAFGEAVMPDELLSLVNKALRPKLTDNISLYGEEGSV